jgi:hypothetical protein
MNILNRVFGGTDALPIDEMLQFVQAAWDRGDAHCRARLLQCIDAVPGFRLSVSAPWKQVAPPFKLGIRRASDIELAGLLKRVFTYGHPSLVEFFHATLHPECRKTAELDGPVPDDSPVHKPHTWCPTASDFDAAQDTVPADLKARFVHFVAVVALVGIETWRAPALGWLNACLRAEGGASAESDPRAAASSVASTDLGALEGDIAIGGRAVESTLTGEASTDPPVEHKEDESEAEAEDDSDDGSSDRGAVERLGELDKIMIDAIVASANGQHGAMALITAERTAHEFALMNLKRAQSFFHWGFALAFTGAPVPPHGKEFSPARRAWLLAGWLNGHARSSPRDAVHRLQHLDPADLAVLKHHSPAASAIAQVLISQFLMDDMTESLIEWMPHVPPGSGAPLRGILRLAERLLREGNSDELHRLANAAWNCRSAAASGLPLELQAMCGRCLRLVGRYDQSADELNNFSEVLAQFVDAPLPELKSCSALAEILLADVDAELELARARVARVEDLWFSKKQTPEALLYRFGSSLPAWSMTVGLGVGNGRVSVDLAYLFALVQLCVTDPIGRHDMDQRCVDALDAALRSMIYGSLDAKPTSLVPRMRLIRALLAARRTEDPAQCALAVEEIIAFESSHACLPSHVIRPVVDAAIVLDNIRVADLLAARAERDVESMLEVCELADAVLYEGVRGVLFGRLREVIPMLPYLKGWDLRLRLFVGAVDAGVQGDSVKELADDLVAVVVARQDHVDDLVRILLDDKRWPAVWDSTGEFAGTLAHLANRSTDADLRLKAAMIIREALMHQVNERGGRALAEDLIEALKDLGVDESWTRDAEDRLNAITSSQPAVQAKPTHQSPARRVLFIGGDERQQREESRTKALLSAMAPHAVATFEYPGWSANWGGPKLDRAKALIEKADVVVTMRFMRTLYGGHIRKLVNERGIQWRATIGHGPHAIARAMAEAVNHLG